MKWSHGHTAGIGALLGLSLAQHGWLILCIGCAAGWFGRDVYTGARSLVRWLRRRALA